MISLRIANHAAAFAERLQAAALAGTQAAANVVADESRELVSQPSPPASRKGEPPRMRSGEGAATIGTEIKLGPDGPAGKAGALDDGSGNFNPLAFYETRSGGAKSGRKWLKPTFDKSLDRQAEAFAHAAQAKIAE